jgi:hypothetical protein
MSSRTLIAAALCALALAPPAAAAAGSYNGRTEVGETISFKATRTQLAAVTVRLHYVCDDGDRFAVVETLPNVRVRNGRFREGFHDAAGGRYVIKGRVADRRVRGEVQATRRFDTAGAPSASGAISCYSSATWTAARRKR